MENNKNERPRVVWKNGKPCKVCEKPAVKPAPRDVVKTGAERTVGVNINTPVKPAARDVVKTAVKPAPKAEVKPSVKYDGIDPYYGYRTANEPDVADKSEFYKPFILIGLTVLVMLFAFMLIFMSPGSHTRSVSKPYEAETVPENAVADDKALSVGSGENNIVYIDPGHGFHDVGAINEDIGVKEMDVTLKLALMLKDKLEEYGITVMLTHDTNVIPEGKKETYKLHMDERNRMANNTPGTKLFLSIHIDEYSEDSKVNGIRVYHMDTDKPAGELCEIIADAYEESGVKRPIIKVGKGMNSLQVVRDSDMPAVLFEAGFMTNPEEAALMLTDKWADDITDVLCGAIVTAFEEKVIGD